jgi:DNA-directed RNA polymerase specialized sigma24 family protein
MLGGRDEAEAVVRASFDEALRVVRRHDRPVRVKALLFTIARTRCVAAVEARGGIKAGTDLRGLDPEVARDADLQLLAAAVGRLPLDQRTVLLLRELDTHTREEVAAISGCPAEKADALLAAARIALADPPPAQDWACTHVRPLLATSGGAPPSREALRRHVTTCESCSALGVALTRQRRYLAIVLPVMPSEDLEAPAPPAPIRRATEPVADGAERPRGLARMRRGTRRA